MEALICELPYPTTGNLTIDVRSGMILSFAYTTSKGELTTFLQYFYHKIFMQKHSADDAKILESIALAELKHFAILGDAMANLGVNPKYVQHPNSQICFETAAISQSITPRKIILDNMRCELDSIAEYKKMLFVLKNEQVSEIVRRIMLDEELHLEVLKQMLQRYAAQSTTCVLNT